MLKVKREKVEDYCELRRTVTYYDKIKDEEKAHKYFSKLSHVGISFSDDFAETREEKHKTLSVGLLITSLLMMDEMFPIDVIIRCIESCDIEVV